VRLVDVGVDDLLLPPGRGEILTERSDDPRAAAVHQRSPDTDAVDAHDVCLILDRACGEESRPVRGP